jgi:predicted site-specific integrase-resolvase
MPHSIYVLAKIGKVAVMLGVTPQTLRAWEASGELVPDRRSAGGTRYYDVGRIARLGSGDMLTIGYAHVSGPNQGANLSRQEESLEAFCTARGWRHEVISDLGPRLDCNKRGLKHLIELVVHKRIRRLVVTHKDRLGSEILFSLCELQNVEVVAINESGSLEEARQRWDASPRPPDG